MNLRTTTKQTPWLGGGLVQAPEGHLTTTMSKPRKRGPVSQQFSPGAVPPGKSQA